MDGSAGAPPVCLLILASFRLIIAVFVRDICNCSTLWSILQLHEARDLCGISFLRFWTVYVLHHGRILLLVSSLGESGKLLQLVTVVNDSS